jgi:hypothetical protein
MTVPPGTFGVRSEDFHLSEYACLRREIELMLKEYRALERNIVFAIGITWGWLYSNRAPAWMFWIPSLFAALGSIRAYGVMKAFGQLGGYLFEIEEAFSRPGSPMGWQHFHGKTTGSAKGAFFFWLILVLATLGVAFLRFCHPSFFSVGQ